MLSRAAKSDEQVVDQAGSIVTTPNLVVKTYSLSNRKVTLIEGNMVLCIIELTSPFYHLTIYVSI